MGAAYKSAEAHHSCCCCYRTQPLLCLHPHICCTAQLTLWRAAAACLASLVSGSDSEIGSKNCLMLQINLINITNAMLRSRLPILYLFSPFFCIYSFVGSLRLFHGPYVRWLAFDCLCGI